MASVDAVEPEVAVRADVAHPRWARIAGLVVVAAVVVGAASWQVVARTAGIEAGSMSSSAGVRPPDCLPNEGVWTLFSKDDDVVAVQTVSNSSPWPVTVISTDPEVFRFEPMAADSQDDWLFDAEPADGAPDTADRVVIPPGREAAMWITNPQGDAFMGPDDGWRSFTGADLRVSVLGVEREVRVPYHGTLYVGGSPDVDRMGEALQEACDA